MVEKLSSTKIISDASFATSVPAIPMEIPMSASFKAGASFTPSPVMATMCPSSRNKRTISCLCFGSARENTTPLNSPSRHALCCCFVICVNSRPVNENSAASRIESKTPISAQIASAVNLLSPVMTITRMPAFLQSLMASFTSGLGGSRKPARPTNVISDSTTSYCEGSFKILYPGCE